MKNNGITLNMDMASMYVLNDSAKLISGGNSHDYVTKISMIVPKISERVPDGLYKVEYKSEGVEVKISTIIRQEQDPIFNSLKSTNINLGASGSGVDFIPIEAFIDNRGKYPTALVEIVFPKRIATWIDDEDGEGMKRDFDYEELQIIGSKNNEEQILSIIVLNRLIESLNIENKNKILYDDITVFLEFYFLKENKKLLLSRLNVLTTKDAYKNAVYDYVLPNFRNSEINQSFSVFHQQYSKKEITFEKDLKLVVEKVIDEVLKHNIEFRRWIDPFWDGERKYKHVSDEIIIPREPKNETRIQPTLHVILDMALAPLGIHVVRETDEGIGSLDFRFLFTTKDRILLTVGTEFKVAHHKEIKKGINKQLPAYLKAIRSSSGIFIVMWFKDDKFFKKPQGYVKEEMEKWLGQEALRVSTELGINLSSTLIDASIRPSASNQ